MVKCGIDVAQIPRVDVTNFGCKVDEDMHGGPHGSILVAYYECNSIREAAEQALTLLDSYYEVTVFSGGYYNPRSYRNKNELRRDFKKWLDEEATWDFCHSVPAWLMKVVGNIHDNPELLEVRPG